MIVLKAAPTYDETIIYEATHPDYTKSLKILGRFYVSFKICFTFPSVLQKERGLSRRGKTENTAYVMWRLKDDQRREKMRSAGAVTNQIVPSIYYKHPTHLVAGKEDVVEAQQLGEHVVLS